jgi:hypothetical protein
MKPKGCSYGLVRVSVLNVGNRRINLKLGFTKKWFSTNTNEDPDR